MGHGCGDDAGMKLEVEGKASVCNGVWVKCIGKRPALNRE